MNELPRGVEGSLTLEIAWSVIPLVIALGIWGTFELMANDGARKRLLRPSVARVERAELRVGNRPRRAEHGVRQAEADEREIDDDE